MEPIWPEQIVLDASVLSREKHRQGEWVWVYLAYTALQGYILWDRIMKFHESCLVGYFNRYHTDEGDKRIMSWVTWKSEGKGSARMIKTQGILQDKSCFGEKASWAEIFNLG